MMKLGVIGLSEGNGHPYSWSAIFNGYNEEFMKNCPFPAIPEYLSKQNFPQDCIQNAEVTHVWTQDKKLSEHIANSANIEHIADNYTDLTGKVDAILLARDDAENHYETALPFIKAGLPIYIDKPLALDIKTANKIFSMQKYKGQVFSCSALRYAKEFQDVSVNKLLIAETPKSWDKYAVHIIEPSLKIAGVKADKIAEFKKDGNTLKIKWESGLNTLFTATNKSSGSIIINTDGKDIIFKNTFQAFKSTLQEFIISIETQTEAIEISETLKITDIIEKGR